MGAGRVLIACGKPEMAGEIASLMAREGFSQSFIASSASEARRILHGFEPDIVIVSTPLPDEQGDSLVLDIHEKCACGIVVLSRQELLADMQHTLEKTGALIIPKPVSRLTLLQTVRFAITTSRSIEGLKSERNSLQKRMDERKTIESAKWILVEKFHMTEPEAHRHIQKKAMDLRLPQVKIAEEIINNFEQSL